MLAVRLPQNTMTSEETAIAVPTLITCCGNSQPTNVSACKFTEIWITVNWQRYSAIDYFGQLSINWKLLDILSGKTATESCSIEFLRCNVCIDIRRRRSGRLYMTRWFCCCHWFIRCVLSFSPTIRNCPSLYRNRFSRSSLHLSRLINLSSYVGLLGGVVVWRRTSDRKIASWLLAGALPGSVGQLSLPSLRGR